MKNRREKWGIRRERNKGEVMRGEERRVRKGQDKKDYSIACTCTYQNTLSVTEPSKHF